MEAIKAFLREQYTDERLAMLQAHIEDGKFVFQSCCCLIGIPTADHALRGEYWVHAQGAEHYSAARHLPGAIEAENEMMWIGGDGALPTDRQRREALLPLVIEEMERREREAAHESGVGAAVSNKYRLSSQVEVFAARVTPGRER